MNVVLFTNCAGGRLKMLFDAHPFTKDKFKVTHIMNYTSLSHREIETTHVDLLANCDVFIYQPLNQTFTSEYNIENIMRYLKNPNVTILRMNYYRFRGFWFENDYRPYTRHRSYDFMNEGHYGLHASAVSIANASDYDEIKRFVDGITIDSEKFQTFFDKEISKMRFLDEKSDVK